MQEEAKLTRGFLPQLGGVLKFWDTGLLLAVLVSIVGMVTFLLFPQPEAALRLQAFSSRIPDIGVTGRAENSGFETPEDLTASGVAITTGSKSDGHHPRTRHHATARKPKHPPVTNLNTATAAQLQLLPNIGPKMAQRVLEYRKAHGRFATAEEIMEVRGIGPKKFEKLKAFLKV